MGSIGADMFLVDTSEVDVKWGGMGLLLKRQH